MFGLYLIYPSQALKQCLEYSGYFTVVWTNSEPMAAQLQHWLVLGRGHSSEDPNLKERQSQAKVGPARGPGREVLAVSEPGRGISNQELLVREKAGSFPVVNNSSRATPVLPVQFSSSHQSCPTLSTP